MLYPFATTWLFATSPDVAMRVRSCNRSDCYSDSHAHGRLLFKVPTRTQAKRSTSRPGAEQGSVRPTKCKQAQVGTSARTHIPNVGGSEHAGDIPTPYPTNLL